jgi:hypothetical protein
MNPPFTTSAMPAARSSAGSVRSVSRSATTAAGSWNAPTRFLPASVLIPVFPPTAASTMPSSVVGTLTRRTPRIQLAATKPPRSVTAPPPYATTVPQRSMPIAASASQHWPATQKVLPASASGIASRCASTPAWRSRSRTVAAPSARVGGWMTATFGVPVTWATSSSARSRPMITS